MNVGHRSTHQRIANALLETPGRPSSSTKSTASVALIFNPTMELLMFKRARRESDPWSGHLSFPGGRIESTDIDPQAAAKRETAEEVGIDLNTKTACLLGRLDDQTTPWLTISAFVYGLSIKPRLTLNEEVDTEFWIPFNDLCIPKNKTTLNFKKGKTKGRYPAVRIFEQTIWGISLRFIDELREKTQ